MARSKAYLVAEAESLGIELRGNEHTSEIMDMLMAIKLDGQDIIKDQFSPMAAKDAKVFFDYELPVPWDNSAMDKAVWGNPNLIAEPKFDGVRMKCHLIGSSKYRFDSRARSDIAYEYNEVTLNFPHFWRYQYNERMADTILDGEVMMPIDTMDTGSVVTQGTLTTTMAVTGSGPNKAIPLQEKYGWCNYHVFDIVKFAGTWVDHFPWWRRRMLLQKIVDTLNNPHILLSPVYVDNDQTFLDLSGKGMKLTRVPSDLMTTFESLVDGGGEGLMFKDIFAEYGIGKRSGAWLKMKKFESADGFITGWLPGKNAFTGLVGAFLVSAYLPNGEVFEFAAVSQMEFDFRKAITDSDGSLKPEYYGRVIEVFGQERTKTDRLRHAILHRWRPDKTPELCLWADQK